ncbi:MAG: glycine cleavage system protein R [Thermodesulfobacteriota bacterium]
MRRYALTATGRDRPGIVAAVTRVLFEHDCNIEDSSMTILEDEFAIILIMAAPEEIDEASLAADIQKTEEETGLTIHVKELGEKARAPAARSNYIITLHGADKSGIVYRTAALLAGHGVNVTDLETTIVGPGDEKVYIMIMELHAPEAVDVGAIEEELGGLAGELGVTIKIKPIEDYEPL